MKKGADNDLIRATILLHLFGILVVARALIWYGLSKPI